MSTSVKTPEAAVVHMVPSGEFRSGTPRRRTASVATCRGGVDSELRMSTACFMSTTMNLGTKTLVGVPLSSPVVEPQPVDWLSSIPWSEGRTRRPSQDR